jgi:hypothetical protein
LNDGDEVANEVGELGVVEPVGAGNPIRDVITRRPCRPGGQRVRARERRGEDLVEQVMSDKPKRLVDGLVVGPNAHGGGCVATREGNRSPLVVHDQGGMIVAVDLADPEGSTKST